MPQVSFRRLTQSDLPTLFSWLGRAHVRRWYAPEPRSYLEMVAKYGDRAEGRGPVSAFVIVVDGADAGYVQSYRLEDFPDYRELLGCEDEPGLAAIDLFIADAWRTSLGLGSLAIRRYFSERALADPAVTACIAGPHEGNAAAIRAFEKAGFRRWKTALDERGERECVLRRDRDTAHYRIAPIRAEDAATCARMCREMYLASFGGDEGLEAFMGPGDSTYFEHLRAKLAQIPQGNAHLWRDGRIVGQLEMRLLDEEPDVGYLSLIYVVPELRGLGLGRRLHDHAMEASRALGKRLMRLSVANRNREAMRFYRRLGWVAVGARADRDSMTVMETPVR